MVFDVFALLCAPSAARDKGESGSKTRCERLCLLNSAHDGARARPRAREHGARREREQPVPLAREVGRLQRDDQRARAIARRARQFAEWALSNETAACYLHRLLTGFAERAMGYAAGPPPTALGGAAGGRQGESVMAGLVHGNDTRFEYRVSRHYVSAGRSERFVAGCRANVQRAAGVFVGPRSMHSRSEAATRFAFIYDVHSRTGVAPSALCLPRGV